MEATTNNAIFNINIPLRPLKSGSFPESIMTMVDASMQIVKGHKHSKTYLPNY